MGYNMVQLLLERNNQVVVYDRNAPSMDAAAKKGAKAVPSIEVMAESLAPPRVFWIMVPHRAVDAVLQELSPFLTRGDTVIDGGNSPYKDSIRRAADMRKRGIDFLDVGVSGGPKGAREGACVMVGGSKEVFSRCEQLFRDIAAADGYAWVGASGAGHFVKMVHNGIEYGMMQALAEGFTVLKNSAFGFDLQRLADLYDHRSVIESRLVGWLKDAYERYGPDLENVSGSAVQSGEGTWTVEAARDMGVPVPVIEGSLAFRLESQKKPSYTGKVISALRHAFGGHEVQEKRKAS
jgi:6-phosphogluconate dehydrogenase